MLTMHMGQMRRGDQELDPDQGYEVGRGRPSLVPRPFLCGRGEEESGNQTSHAHDWMVPFPGEKKRRYGNETIPTVVVN